MKIKFIFDTQFCGYAEQIIELQSNVSDEDIKSMFPIVMDLEYDENCSYEIVQEGE